MRAFDFRVPSETESDALQRLLSQSFAISFDLWSTWFARIGRENLRVVVDQDNVIGGLGVYRMGQFFGGASVPIAGIAGVGIAPESRGLGVAKGMMLKALGEFRESGFPLAGLFASTTSLYRRCGFEQAGVWMMYSAPLATLPPGDRTLACTPIEPKQHESFHTTYAARARGWTGHLDRNTAIWERITRPHGQTAYAYRFGDSAAMEGYVVFVQRSRPDGHFDVIVKDLVVHTRAAAQRALALLYDLRSLAVDVEWSGCSADPLVGLFPGADVPRDSLRALDVACSARRSCDSAARLACSRRGSSLARERRRIARQLWTEDLPVDRRATRSDPGRAGGSTNRHPGFLRSLFGVRDRGVFACGGPCRRSDRRDPRAGGSVRRPRAVVLRLLLGGFRDSVKLTLATDGERIPAPVQSRGEHGARPEHGQHKRAKCEAWRVAELQCSSTEQAEGQ